MSGFIWNAINIASRQGLTLLIHISLARLLVPEDFGIIGMISIFMELSLRLQGAGLGEALVRKKNVCKEECNFVFYYRLCVGSICYVALFFTAPLIANFFSQPVLTGIVRIIGINLILIPLKTISIVQLIKNMQFHNIAKIEISSGIGAGLVAVYLAYQGFGVWSLVGQAVSLHVFSFFFFYAFNPWHPSLSLDRTKSKALFSFGSQLMISNFIETGFNNIYNIIIGKNYSAALLGFYSQGTKLQKLPSNAINGIIKGVSFPAFSSIRDDKHRYKNIFQKTMRLLTYLNFIALLSLAAIADPLIPLLLSDKWIKTIPFFQMLTLIGLMVPIKSLYINVLKVEGKGDILIKYVVLTKIFYLLIIAISIRLNIYALVAGQVLAVFLELMVFSRIGNYIDYRLTDLVKDILPNLAIALMSAGSLLTANHYLSFMSPFRVLCCDIAIGATVVIILSTFFKNPSFREIKIEFVQKAKITR